jgi:hypothetical protein
MGTWGTGLSSNDTFADIYGEFFELYNEGQDVKEITSKLLTTNKDLLTDKGDSNNFFGLQLQKLNGNVSRWTTRFTTGSKALLRIKRTWRYGKN